MSETEGRKRPWFQIHLTTAMIVMLEVGAILGANVLSSAPGKIGVYGWPVNFAIHRVNDPWERGNISLPQLILNLSIILVAVLMTTMVCEQLVRHRFAPMIHKRSFAVFALALAIIVMLNVYPFSPERPVSGEVYGWPITVKSAMNYTFDGTSTEWNVQRDNIYRILAGRSSSRERNENGRVHIELESTNVSPNEGLDLGALRINVLLGILMVLSGTVVCEVIVRRRGAHKA